MLWNVDNIYSFVKFLIRKNQGGGISSTDLFYSWNAEQKAYMADMLGHWQARANGKTGLNTGLIENETIMQKLAVFIKNANLTIASGVSSKPTDLIYRLAMRINGVDCFKINHNQIASVNDSVIDAPSVANDSYYFVEYATGYTFLPASVTAATLDYISDPLDIVWAYTYNANNRQVYNPTGSVQPLWDNLSIIEITKRSLKSLGISFKDADFSNFGNSNITTGD